MRLNIPGEALSSARCDGSILVWTSFGLFRGIIFSTPLSHWEHVQFDEVQIDSEIISIHSGSSHFIIHTKDGLYGLGYNISGQLGPVLLGQFIHDPLKIKTPLEPMLVSCAEDHTMIQTEKGVFVIGAIPHHLIASKHGGKLKTSKWKKIDTIPHQVQILSIVSTSCTTFVVTTKGIYSTGRYSGQYNVTKIFSPITGIPGEICYFTCGESQAFVISTEGIYGWGIWSHKPQQFMFPEVVGPIIAIYLFGDMDRQLILTPLGFFEVESVYLSINEKEIEVRKVLLSKIDEDPIEGKMIANAPLMRIATSPLIFMLALLNSFLVEQ